MLSVQITGLTREELKELLLKLREIEQRDPKRSFFIDVKGTENMKLTDAQALLSEVFPPTETKPLMVSIQKGEHPTCEQVRQIVQMPVDLNNRDPEYMRVHREAMEHLLNCKECFVWSYRLCEKMREERYGEPTA